MPTYDPTQTVFTLSMIANLASGIKGTVAEIESAAGTAMNNAIQAAAAGIGTWKLVWGPAVYQAPNSNIADNVMAIFQAGTGAVNPGQLVVGIAGTNPYSGFDWLLEDFLVITSVPWAYGNTGALKPRISLGTYIGLNILQALMPGPGIPGVGLTLQNFLESTLKAKTPVTVAGHSLGGALSPAAALWLSDTKSHWDPSGFSTLACLPSAGPTSGDLAFAAYYNSQLGDVTTRIYNSLDVVPHAWETSDLVRIPDLYSPYIDPTLAIYGLLLTAVAISADKVYTQICKSTLALQGTVNHGQIDPTKTACDNFVLQMFYQHVGAYFDLLGLGTSSLKAVFAQMESQEFAKIQSTALRKELIRKRSTVPLV